MLIGSEIFDKVKLYENLEEELKQEVLLTPFFKLYKYGLKHFHIYHRDLYDKKKSYLRIGQIHIKNICIPRCYDKKYLKKHGSMIRLSLNLDIFDESYEHVSQTSVMLDIPEKLLYAKDYLIVKFLNDLEKETLKQELECQELNLKFIKDRKEDLIEKINCSKFKLSLRLIKK